MTATEFAHQLRQAALEIQAGKALQRAAQSVHADRVVRIFDSPGVGGSYNKTNPVYVKNSQLRRTNKGKSGKAKDTSYFKSYYDLKQEQGFDADTVNLRLTNDLQMDFANSKIDSGTGAVDVGNVIKESELLYVEKIRSSENMKKLKSNIKKFGNFLEFTPEETNKFNTILEAELLSTLRGERR